MIRVLSNSVPGEHFTMLVSGGIDSIAAAHWMKHAYRREFTILHFNHNIQDANDHMENAVSSFAEQFTIPIKVIRSLNKLKSSEDKLREWRLNEMSNLTGNFVTGHHLNDAVENYLDNCFKGCPEYKPIQEVTHFKQFSIYHPFITTTKESFTQYAKKHNLDQFVVVDPTNTDIKYKRNWIRNNIAQEVYNRNIGIEKIVKNKFYNNVK